MGKTDVSQHLDDSEFIRGWSLAEPTPELLRIRDEVEKFYADRPDVHRAVIRFVKGTPITPGTVVELVLITSAEYDGQRYGHSTFLHPSVFAESNFGYVDGILHTEADRLYAAFHAFILGDWLDARRKKGEAGRHSGE